MWLVSGGFRNSYTDIHGMRRCHQHRCRGSALQQSQARGVAGGRYSDGRTPSRTWTRCRCAAVVQQRGQRHDGAGNSLPA